MRKIVTILAASALTACTATAPVRPQPASIPVDKPAAAVISPRPLASAKGLEAVMGKDSAALIRMFGSPRLDVVEVQGRKLQFAGKPCILDAYLYPEGRNGGEVVTHVDARRSDGAEVDRAQCVNALMQR
jgi:hypothetical protein